MNVVECAALFVQPPSRSAPSQSLGRRLRARRVAIRWSQVHSLRLAKLFGGDIDALDLEFSRADWRLDTKTISVEDDFVPASCSISVVEPQVPVFISALHKVPAKGPRSTLSLVDLVRSDHVVLDVVLPSLACSWACSADLHVHPIFGADNHGPAASFWATSDRMVPNCSEQPFIAPGISGSEPGQEILGDPIVANVSGNRGAIVDVAGFDWSIDAAVFVFAGGPLILIDGDALAVPRTRGPEEHVIFETANIGAVNVCDAHDVRAPVNCQGGCTVSLGNVSLEETEIEDDTSDTALADPVVVACMPAVCDAHAVHASAECVRDFSLSDFAVLRSAIEGLQNPDSPIEGLQNQDAIHEVAGEVISCIAVEVSATRSCTFQGDLDMLVGDDVLAVHNAKHNLNVVQSSAGVSSCFVDSACAVAPESAEPVCGGGRKSEVSEVAEPVCGELVRAVWEDGLLACDMDENIRYLPYDCQCRGCEVMVSWGRVLRECLISIPLRGCRDFYVAELVDDVRWRLCGFLLVLPRDHFQPFAQRLAEHIAGTFPAILAMMGRLDSQSESSGCYKQYLAVLSDCWRGLSSDDVLRLFPV